MKRILALDYGQRRIGLAVSDPLQVIAGPLNTLEIHSPEDAIRQLTNVCRDYDPELLLVGYPIGNSGNKTEQTRIVDVFIDKLQTAFSIPVLKWDERFTSIAARDKLWEQGIKTRNNKGLIDQMAARIMLQEYLDSRRNW
jgi:putative holliday junction resolvase